MGSEGLAKMAAEQSAIRQRLEQLRNELNKKGKGEGNQLNPLIEELKEQQKNIINKNINKETINSYVNRTKSVDLFLFFVTVEKLPFHDEVFEALKNHFPEFKLLPLDKRRLLFVEFLLSKKYFDFGEYPKGLLPFHNYKTHISTAFEEHLVEASQYAAIDGNATLHFTISNQHQNQFLEHYNSIKEIVESKTNTSFDISYSFQDSKTC